MDQELPFISAAMSDCLEPITEEPILRCARTQRNVCFGAANIHAASQLWILSFVRNVENFSEAVAAQRTLLPFEFWLLRSALCGLRQPSFVLGAIRDFHGFDCAAKFTRKQRL